METKYQTIKIWKTTLAALRLLAAMQETSMILVLDTLIQTALNQQKNKG